MHGVLTKHAEKLSSAANTEAKAGGDVHSRTIQFLYSLRLKINKKIKTHTNVYTLISYLFK